MLDRLSGPLRAGPVQTRHGAPMLAAATNPGGGSDDWRDPLGREGEACSSRGGLACQFQGEKGMANLVERGAHSQRLVSSLA